MSTTLTTIIAGATGAAPAAAAATLMAADRLDDRRQRPRDARIAAAAEARWLAALR